MSLLKMKSKILIFIFFSALISCKEKSPDQILIAEADTFFQKSVIPNIDDPNSYEKISTIILDTMSRVEYLKDLKKSYSERLFWIESSYKSTKDLYESTVRSNKEFAKYSSAEGRRSNEEREKKYLEDVKKYEGEVNETKSKIDSIDFEIKNTVTDEIFSIKLHHNFRARNKFGALVKETVEVRYYPKETDPTKKFYIKTI